MEFHKSITNALVGNDPKNKKKWLKIGLITLGVVLVLGGIFYWVFGATVGKMSLNSNLLGSVARMIPGVNSELKGEKEDRINVLLLGMRGENVPGGGTLADTIMVASIKPQENKVAMLSIPRDLFVDNPAMGYKTKINAVYVYGEQKRQGGGIEDMKKVVGEIVGQEIPYALVINFKGFTDLVNAIGGVEITLDQPFNEAMQFNEEHVCDSFFTVPTGKFENKTQTYYSEKSRMYKKRVVESYPLCTAPAQTLECGGDFKLPAGKQIINGEQALCYARSRKTSSDFERAKRQQMVIGLIKDKAMTAGTLTDFSKVNGILNSLGDNVKTDIQAWEMKRMYEFYSKMQNPQTFQHVLENSEEGLLYTPPQTPETGYILAPIGDNFDKIRELFANIFNKPSQSDIKPR